jgi:hypothetical protein
MNQQATPGAIESDIPFRPDRLPWCRFHWLEVVLGVASERKSLEDVAAPLTSERPLFSR